MVHGRREEGRGRRGPLSVGEKQAIYLRYFAERASVSALAQELGRMRSTITKCVNAQRAVLEAIRPGLGARRPRVQYTRYIETVMDRCQATRGRGKTSEGEAVKRAIIGVLLPKRKSAAREWLRTRPVGKLYRRYEKRLREGRITVQVSRPTFYALVEEIKTELGVTDRPRSTPGGEGAEPGAPRSRRGR